MKIVRIIKTGTNEYFTLQADPAFVHPEWVHAQLGTTSEQELRVKLEQLRREP